MSLNQKIFYRGLWAGILLLNLLSINTAFAQCDYAAGSPVVVTAADVNSTSGYATVILYGAVGGNFVGSQAATMSGSDASATFVGLAAGTYTFYAVNYLTNDYDGTPHLVINHTNYANVSAINATSGCKTVQQFDATVCTATSIHNGTNCALECTGVNGAVINRADPGTYPQTAGYIQTYVVTNGAGVILQVSSAGTFTTGTGTNQLSAVGSPYSVYALNYNSADVAANTAVSGIVAGTTNISTLQTADAGGACMDISATALPLCVNSCDCPLVEGAINPCGSDGDNEYVIMTNTTGADLPVSNLILGILQEDGTAGAGFDSDNDGLYNFNYSWTSAGTLPGGLAEVGMGPSYAIVANGATMPECPALADCAATTASPCTTAELITALNSYTLGYPVCAPVFVAPPASGIPAGANFILFQGAAGTGATAGFDNIFQSFNFSAYCGQTIYALFGSGTSSGYFDDNLLRAYYISYNGGAGEVVIPADANGTQPTKLTDCAGTLSTAPACNTVAVTTTKNDITFTDNNGDGVLSAGDVINYQVIVSNTGTGFANQVNFTDNPTLSNANLSLVGSVTTTYSGSDSPTITNNSTVTTVNVCISTIAPAQSLTVNFSALVGSGATGTVCNQGASQYPDPTDASTPYTQITVNSDDPATVAAADPTCAVICTALAATPSGSNMTLCSAGGALTGTNAATTTSQVGYTTVYLLVNNITGIIESNATSPSALTAPANAAGAYCGANTADTYTIYALQYITTASASFAIVNGTTALTAIYTAIAAPNCADISASGLTVTVNAPIVATTQIGECSAVGPAATYDITVTICGGSGTYSNLTASSFSPALQGSPTFGTWVNNGDGTFSATVSNITSSAAATVTITLDDSNISCTDGTTSFTTQDCDCQETLEVCHNQTLPLLTTPPSGAPVGANASVSGVNTTGTYRVDFILVCANAIAETDPNAAVGAPSTMGNAAAVIGKVFVTGDNCVLYAVNYDSATGTPVYTPGSGNTLSVTGAVCLAKSVACIQVNPLPTFTLTPTNPVCPSTTNGSILVSGLIANATGYTVAYVGPTSGTLSNQTASASGTIDITGLTGSASSNNYTVTVTNSSGCSASNTTTVASVTCCPTLSSAPANVTIVNSTCQQVCTVAGGSISAPSGTPCPTGSHIEYSTDGGNTWTSTLPTYGAGVSVQTRCECDLDANVVSPASTAVSTSPGTCTDPTPTAVSSNDLTCIVTTSTLSITGLSAGTYNYNWAASAGGTISGGTTSATATGISAGTYEVTVTNATTGCSATSSMNVTANTTAPTPTASSSNNLTCTVTSTSLSVTGLSAGTYSYNWATSGGGNLSGSTT
ncbi:MAG: hypothetical protein IT273_03080, partial [Chitinophagales bacterium]|nr:hypothetical protein [Chitinophagales bacterium]